MNWLLPTIIFAGISVIMIVLFVFLTRRQQANEKEALVGMKIHSRGEMRRDGMPVEAIELHFPSGFRPEPIFRNDFFNRAIAQWEQSHPGWKVVHVEVVESPEGDFPVIYAKLLS